MNKVFILFFCLLVSQIGYPQDIEPEVGSEAWLKKRNDEFTKSIEETINADPVLEQQKAKNNYYQYALEEFQSSQWITHDIYLSNFKSIPENGIEKAFVEREIQNFLLSLPINSYEVIDVDTGYDFIYIKLNYTQTALDAIHHYPHVTAYEYSRSYPAPKGLHESD